MKKDHQEAMEQEMLKEKQKHEEMLQYKNKLHQQLIEQVMSYIYHTRYIMSCAGRETSRSV